MTPSDPSDPHETGDVPADGGARDPIDPHHLRAVPTEEHMNSADAAEELSQEPEEKKNATDPDREPGDPV